MESFAFAYKLRNHKKDDFIAAECHINIWKVNSGTISNNSKLYFDFGLMLDSDIEYIYAYIPFNFKEDYCNYDLIKKLQHNTKLLCAIFNCDYKIQTVQWEPNSKVSDKYDLVKFSLHQLGPTKFQVTPFYGINKKQIIGKLLRIQIQETPSDIPKVYIRFRIEAISSTEIVKSEHISNDLLQSAFSQMDMYDLRINESRNISTDVIDKIKGDGYETLPFDKIHLFYMADTKEIVDNGSSLKQDSRLLEKDIWTTYLPAKSHNRNYIAHHWKKRIKKEEMNIVESKIERKETFSRFNDYHIFFTTIYPHIQLVRLGIYFA